MAFDLLPHFRFALANRQPLSSFSVSWPSSSTDTIGLSDGAIVPKLLAYEPWGLTPVQTGAIGSYALAGMFTGAILIGYLTDIVGRRKVMMVSIAAFSLLMLLTVGRRLPNSSVCSASWRASDWAVSSPRRSR